MPSIEFGRSETWHLPFGWLKEQIQSVFSKNYSATDSFNQSSVIEKIRVICVMSILNSNIDSRMRLITWGSGIFAILISLGLLQIWIIETVFAVNGRLLNLGIEIPLTINFFAPLCLVLSGISLLLIQRLESNQPLNKKAQMTVKILAASVICVALILFIQAVWAINSDANGNFVSNFSRHEASFLVKIPINLTLSLLLFGIGLLTIDKETSDGQMPAQYLGFVIIILSFFSLLGVIYETVFLHPPIVYTINVVLIATSLLVLAVGLFCARPERGILSLLQSRSSGGQLARQLFPAAILIPGLLGGLIFLGLQAGYYDAILGLALLSVTQIIVFQMIFWRNSLLVHNLDTERANAKEELRKAYEKLAERVKKQTTEIEVKTQKLTQEMTARQRAQEALSVQAETTNRIKDEFLAIISHELRSPLNSILGWATMLKNGMLDPEMTTKAVDIIERSARSQNLLINDLLDISMMISGKTRLQLAPLQPENFVSNAIESLRPSAEEKGLTLKQDFQKNVQQVNGDGERLQQVVRNLIANAIKFTPEGGQIEVKLRNRNNGVLISVADTGVGIEPDFIPFVFERFRQADSSHTRKHGGLGLGLSIVRHLVELHGGVVGVESYGEGKGTTFYIELPRYPKTEKAGHKPVMKLKSGALHENASKRQELYI
jgi:signal transduction histidine kinase